jgi:hypothetical protein
MRAKSAESIERGELAANEWRSESVDGTRWIKGEGGRRGDKNIEVAQSESVGELEKCVGLQTLLNIAVVLSHCLGG